MSTALPISQGDITAWIIDKLGALGNPHRDAILRAINAFFDQRSAPRHDNAADDRAAAAGVYAAFAIVAQALDVDDDDKIRSWGYLNPNQLRVLPDLCLEKIASLNTRANRPAPKYAQELVRVAGILGVVNPQALDAETIANLCRDRVAEMTAEIAELRRSRDQLNAEISRRDDQAQRER